MKSKLLYERALITCVLMLLVSVILKLFGVPWFNLDTSIPILNKINDIVMNSNTLSFIYSFIFRYIHSYLVCCITLKTLKQRHLLLTFFVISTMLSRLLFNDVMCFLIDFNILLIYCMCINKRCFKEYYMVMILNMIYQLVSLFIRNLGIGLGSYGMVSSILLNLDYYIMLIITYLYLKKGETTLCGIFHVCYSSLATKLWRKPTQNSNQCSSKES